MGWNMTIEDALRRLLMEYNYAQFEYFGNILRSKFILGSQKESISYFLLLKLLI